MDSTLPSPTSLANGEGRGLSAVSAGDADRNQSASKRHAHSRADDVLIEPLDPMQVYNMISFESFVILDSRRCAAAAGAALLPSSGAVFAFGDADEGDTKDADDCAGGAGGAADASASTASASASTASAATTTPSSHPDPLLRCAAAALTHVRDEYGPEKPGILMVLDEDGAAGGPAATIAQWLATLPETRRILFVEGGAAAMAREGYSFLFGLEYEMLSCLPQQITPQLFLGSAGMLEAKEKWPVVSSERLLNIRGVLSVVERKMPTPLGIKEEDRRLLHVADSDDADLTPVFEEAVPWLRSFTGEDHLRLFATGAVGASVDAVGAVDAAGAAGVASETAGGAAGGRRVVVHCERGVSRSASMVIAHLVINLGWDLDAALEHARICRPCVRPNRGFMDQLRFLANNMDQFSGRGRGGSGGGGGGSKDEG